MAETMIKAYLLNKSGQKYLDSRLRGNDDSHKVAFTRHSREGGNPEKVSQYVGRPDLLRSYPGPN